MEGVCMNFTMKYSKYIHVIIETLCFMTIMMYIRKNIRKLQDQINDLNKIIQQQQEMLFIHQQLLKERSTPSLNIIDSSTQHSFLSHNDPSEFATMFTVPFQTPQENPLLESERIEEVVVDTEPPLSRIEEEELEDEKKQEEVEQKINIEKELENEIQELKMEEEDNLDKYLADEIKELEERESTPLSA